VFLDHRRMINIRVFSRHGAAATVRQKDALAQRAKLLG
jgi:hypothetical protein